MASLENNKELFEHGFCSDVTAKVGERQIRLTN
jgi:hypothetical protein